MAGESDDEAQLLRGQRGEAAQAKHAQRAVLAADCHGVRRDERL